MNQMANDYPFLFVEPESFKLFDLASKVTKTETPAIISGQSDTGKEVLAGVLCESSHRSELSFGVLI